MSFYRARKIGIYGAAFALCIGTPIYGAYIASTISNFKQNSLEQKVETDNSSTSTKIAKAGVGAIMGLIASAVPTTAVMTCLGRKKYI